MLNLYHQEIFKLMKKRSTWICTILLVIQNMTFAIIGKSYPQFVPRQLFADDFATISFIIFIIIAATASIISTEFEYNTIKNMVSKSYSRKTILFSKWLTILTYSSVLFLFITLLSFINKVILYGSDFSLADKLPGINLPTWQYWLLTVATNFFTMWLLLSAVFLMASMLKKGTTAITLGIVSYFAISVIGRIMFLFINKWDFIKWNPINLMNYPSQLAFPDLEKLTHLNNIEMFTGSAIYMIIFMGLGMYLFSKKEV